MGFCFLLCCLPPGNFRAHRIRAGRGLFLNCVLRREARVKGTGVGGGG